VHNQQLNENLREKDLKNLINNIFEIDSYKSKMGEDKDIVVLSFTVEDKEPADDLVNFIERGYDFVLDADVTPGELKDGRYKVFVEIERNRRSPENILEILDGVGKLSGIENFKFRYYKSFNSIPADQNTITEMLPTSKDSYEIKIKESVLNNFSNFFSRSYVESISVEDEDIVFHKLYSGPLRMKIKGFGKTNEIYEGLKGPMMLESKDMAEILYITKYLGNYNITKVGNQFVFENENYALVLERI
jgi:hypothetical protein